MAARFSFMVLAVFLACLVQHANSEKLVQEESTGRYIIRIKEDAIRAKSDVMRTFSTDVKSHKMNITHEYSNLFQGFSASMTIEVKNKMEAAGDVEIFADTVVKAFCNPRRPRPPKPAPTKPARKVPPPSWGLDRIDQRSLPLDMNPPVYKGDGEDVHIYIVDTGIYKSHEEFEDRVQGQGFSAVNQDANTDCNGHGTHVAGTAAGRSHGVAKKAALHSVQVLNCTGFGNSSGIIAGLDWIAEQARTPEGSPAVVSMSLGGGANTALNEAVEALIESGVVVVVAAGNEEQDACNVSPASVPHAITVGASTISDTLAGFSNHGSCVDILAPGKDIKSAGIGSNSQIRSFSGTSMACPHVSGAAAILLGLNPGWNPSEVDDELGRLSTKNKVGGLNSDTPNKLLFIKGHKRS